MFLASKVDMSWSYRSTMCHVRGRCTPWLRSCSSISIQPPVTEITLCCPYAGWYKSCQQLFLPSLVYRVPYTTNSRTICFSYNVLCTMSYVLLSECKSTWPGEEGMLSTSMRSKRSANLIVGAHTSVVDFLSKFASVALQVMHRWRLFE